MAAEQGKETGAPPPPPRETETVDGKPAEAATADLVAPLTSDPVAPPLAAVEPGEEIATPPAPPPPLPREAEPTDAVAPALDAALPTPESARRAPPQDNPDAAAAGQPQPTTTVAGALPVPLPPTPTKAEEVAALPPPAETPSLGRVLTAAAVEAEKQLPAAAAPAPPQQQSLPPPPPPQQQQQQEASSVHEEKKDAAAPVTAQEGEKKKPEEKLAAPAPPMAQDGRSRWRHLQAAVRLIFLRCKRGDQSTLQSPMPEDKRGEAKPSASGLEEKKPTLADEGETKPPAPGGEQPASGQERVATSRPPPPPPAETSSLERPATAIEAEKPLAAPPPQQPPPHKEEGGAPGQASSVEEEEGGKGAAQAKAAEGEEKTARRRWRCLQAAVRLLFLRPDSSARHGDQLSMDKEDEVKPPASGLEGTKTQAEKPDSGGGDPAEPHQGEMKLSAPDGGVPASGQKEQKPAPKPGVKRKDEGEESKRRHDETLAAPADDIKSPRRAESHAGAVADPEGRPAGKTTTTTSADSAPGSSTKRLQKAVKLLLRIMSWYKEHRSSSKRVDGEPQGGTAPPMEEVKPATVADGDKGADADTKTSPADGKQPASGPEEKEKLPHPKWAQEEERLEEILEGAFTRLLAAEYHQLRPIRKKCLLTFSVFDLASEVKKQVMVYWWVSVFNIRHRSDQSSAADAAPAENRRSSCWQARNKTAAHAGGGNHSPAPEGGKAEDHGGNNPDTEAEGIFSELSSHGFLEPMKNWCSRVIHGCKVNPLVHWMLKRRARDDRFADLDVKGSPAALQPSSSILCLTSGNRELLQRMRMEDESQQAGSKSKTNTTRSNSLSQQSPAVPDKAATQDPKDTESTPTEEIAKLFKRKQVILNINAHVYPVSKSTFSQLADSLVVLQLGRWCNLDDNTYMEVDGLESFSTIGLLKNLRYLSLRGLSRLTELPKGIRKLRKLAILDMRGCQNLVKLAILDMRGCQDLVNVASKINVASRITTPLKQLTHLDLTECYMLEHIGREIASLSELQVFKGFVFATRTQSNNACRLHDLRRLKKLQKLTVSITTDANVARSEMVELKHLVSLRKLTITWSEIPSILEGDSKRRDDLIAKWTNFELPQDLLKLDLRCYPKKELKLKVPENLKKLYLRGGDLKKFSFESIGELGPSNSSKKTNSIKTLRLRYLKYFSMKWEDIRSLLRDIEYVEIVIKDEKPMKDVNKDQKDREKESKVVKDGEMKGQKDREEECNLVMKKKTIYPTLDENGVWVKDQKEEYNLSLFAHIKEKEAQNTMEKSKVSGPIEDPNKADSIVKDNEDDNTTQGKSEGKRDHVATNERPQ